MGRELRLCRVRLLHCGQRPQGRDGGSAACSLVCGRAVLAGVPRLGLPQLLDMMCRSAESAGLQGLLLLLLVLQRLPRAALPAAGGEPAWGDRDNGCVSAKHVQEFSCAGYTAASIRAVARLRCFCRQHPPAGTGGWQAAAAAAVHGRWAASHWLPTSREVAVVQQSGNSLKCRE